MTNVTPLALRQMLPLLAVLLGFWREESRVSRAWLVLPSLRLMSLLSRVFVQAGGCAVAALFSVIVEDAIGPVT